MAGVWKSAYTYVCITYFRLESEFQHGIHNAYVRTYVCHSRLEYIICIPARNFLPLARTYVRIPLWYVRTYMELRSLQMRKLIPAGNSTYVRTYIHIPAWLEHCGELSGIRICIFCCKVRKSGLEMENSGTKSCCISFCLYCTYSERNVNNTETHIAMNVA